jgi:hypothetical protein
LRTVKLTWKKRVTRKKKVAILKWIRRFYSTARDRGDFVELLAGNDDTKFIWIFMFSKTFNNIE